MQSEWFSLLNGWLSLYILQISADSSLCMSSRFEDFSDKLEEGSKLCEAYTEGTVIQTYNIFRITDRENDLCNFLKLYESAYGEIRHAKMYTIITFVTLNGEEMGKLSNSRDLFIEFVINYVRRKDDCYILGNVYMTIECIPAEHIKEYDFINTNVVNIKKVLHKFEEIVVESICEITLSVIKERIVKDVRYFLYDEFLGKESLLSENFSVDESVFRTKHEYRISALINSANNGRMYEFLPWRFGGKYVTFNKLCSKILEYESTIGVRYFTVNPYELFRNFEYLTHEKHKKAFDKGIMDVIMRVASNLKEEIIIERFVYIMRELLRKTIEVINDPKQFKDSKCLHNYQDADYLNFLFSNVEIVALFDDYFEMLQFDDIQKSLEDKYKLKENTPIKKPPAENISKILFDEELTDTSVYTLFHVLEDAGVLEKISMHQTIFVQRGSLVEIDNRVIGYKKHKSAMISLTVNNSTISAFIETIEKTTRPYAESMDLDLEDFSVPMNKMGLSACANDKLAMCTESNKKVRDVKITIAKYEKLVPGIGFEGLIEQLENMCLDNQKFTSIIKRMVSIVHNSEKSYIYIIYQFDAASRIYKLSLIYNVYSKSSTGNCTEFGISNRFVKCFDNGPLLLLNNLHGCLQCMQLSAYDEFEIPNLWIIDNIEYAYTQKVVYAKLYQRANMGIRKIFLRD